MNTFSEIEPIKVSLEAYKSLMGRGLKIKFDFELYDSTGQLLETKMNDGSSITFASLNFDKAGIYTYTIKEKAGTEKGMSYDSKTVTATIVISEADNKLESTVTYTDDDGQNAQMNSSIPLVRLNQSRSR
ncbi:MAG: Spy0128 family protein [Enterococcus sp.]|uniref:Spy0128 family protein n=1 Tax=Enterococcus sp. TaxID=35783 RepID=UPI003994DEE2